MSNLDIDLVLTGIFIALWVISYQLHYILKAIEKSKGKANGI